jgi:CRP-like cAMP-binding protein
LTSDAKRAGERKLARLAHRSLPSVELHVSQRELGNMAGGSRESVNKILLNWHRRGLIDLSKGSIIIHNVEAIERLV